jgi:deoxyribodipyrimidine photolyase
MTLPLCGCDGITVASVGTAPPLAILWFRRDLRLSDHPALSAAACTSCTVYPNGWREPAKPGVDGAQWTTTKGASYASDRDRPDRNGTSRLSAWCAGQSRAPADYPVPVVDHGHERRVSLDRCEAVRTP